MNTAGNRSKTSLKELVSGWPHLTWVGFYAGLDKLGPSPSQAVLEDVQERGDALVITAREGTRTFTAGVPIADPAVREAIMAILSQARGISLEAVGSIEIAVRE